MKIFNLLVTVSLSLVGLGIAQTPVYNVSPQGYGTKSDKNLDPGLWNSTYGTASYMQIHAGIPNPGKPILSEISFRRGTYPVSYKAFSPNITLRVSTPVTNPATASTTYKSNHGLDLVEVITKTTMNFPVTAWKTISPFEYVMKFTNAQPFVFKPLGKLCWELRIHSGNGGSQNWMDYIDGKKGMKGVNFGQGCQASTATTAPAVMSEILDNSATTPNNWGLKSLVSGLANSQPYLFMIGTNKTRFGPVTLPFDLSPLGAKGCSLYMAPIINFAGTTASTGAVLTYYMTPISFPKHPAFAGQTLYAQWACVDPGKAPNMPLTLSCGVELPIPGNMEVTRIYTKTNPAATVGTVEAGSGLIMRFTFR